MKTRIRIIQNYAGDKVYIPEVREIPVQYIFLAQIIGVIFTGKIISAYTPINGECECCYFSEPAAQYQFNSEAAAKRIIDKYLRKIMEEKQKQIKKMSYIKYP